MAKKPPVSCKPYFTPATLQFFRDLARHNERDWFLAHKATYEQVARDPFLALIRDLAPRLERLSPLLVVDPRPVGGSMMRIHRDTRFSRDKTPYKASMSARFMHGRGLEGASPGFYLHLAPGDSGLGSGLWRPEGDALTAIRDAIVADPKGWTRAAAQREFKTGCGMIGESLKRPPRGYDADHPCIEDLKRKDFAISSPLTDAEVLGPDLLDVVMEGFEAQARFVGFLCQALGLKF